MTDVNKTLEERGARYGQFIDHATIAQGLQEVLQEAPNWYRLQPDVRQMMVVITDKLARILNGDPDYTDNYHDIQGYARLVEARLLMEQKEKSAQNAKLFEDDEIVAAGCRTTEEELTEPLDYISDRNYPGLGPVDGDWEAVGNYRG